MDSEKNGHCWTRSEAEEEREGETERESEGERGRERGGQ